MPELKFEEILSEDGKTFTLKFRAPKQLLLREDHEDLIHDECLRHAHARGLIPVGPTIISKEELPEEPRVQGPLKEGESMADRIRTYMTSGQMQRDMWGSGALGGPKNDLLLVTVSVTIGSSLDLTLEDVTATKTVDTIEEALEKGVPDDPWAELDGLG